jgi:hypothetical protein
MKSFKKNNLNQQGRAGIEILAIIIVVLVFGLIGTIIYKNNAKTNAGSDNYQSLGSVNWNPNITAYYANSKFYNFACVSQNLKTMSVSVNGEIIATSFVNYMKSGNYLPSITTRIDSKISSYGSNWKFGDLQNINGAYISFNTGPVSLTSTYQSGPQATNYWPSVWSAPIVVQNLSTCNGSPLITPSEVQTDLTVPVSASATQIEVNSAKDFPQSGNYYIQIDSEKMLVTAGQGSTTWTIVRGLSGTQPVNHLVNSTIQELAN